MDSAALTAQAAALTTQAAALTEEAAVILSRLAAWAAAVLPEVLGALLILVIGWWLAGRAERGMVRLLNAQTRIDPTLRGVISSLVRYGILVMVIVAALAQLGVQTTSVIAALGAIGLAIGLALQGTLANIAAGFMLLWLRPFKVGDQIDTGAVAGTVKEVGLFASELHTGDGVFLFVPNAQLWNTKIINYSRLPTRMAELQFGVGLGDDIAAGLKVLSDLAASDARVRKKPPPVAFVDRIGDGTVFLGLRVWTPTADYGELRWDLIRRGKAELEAAGLTMPVPQRDIRIHGADAPPA